MQNPFVHYRQLAGLFRYPDGVFPDQARRVQTFLNTNYPRAAAQLEPFTGFASQAPLTDLEELFTRSFEVQAITTLDLGYVLFGDDYKRGALLVNLNREHREAGNDCRTELADHLPNVLRLLPGMIDPQVRAELVEKIVAPALRKIICEFDPQKMQQKSAIYKKHHKTLIESPRQYPTIYRHPLEAVYTVLEADFELRKAEQFPEQSRGFLKSLGSEMNLES